jgi:hypothetical protein
MHVSEPAIRQAAALTIHWQRGDIEAVVLLMAEEIGSQDEAEDVITALLMLRGRDLAEMEELVLGG